MMSIKTIKFILLILSTLGLIEITVANNRDNSKWISLDQDAKPDTKAEIQINERSSNEKRTVFTINIPGFWATEKKGPNGKVYQQIEIPGLGSHNQLGAPDLPAYHYRLAVPISNQANGKLEVKVEDRRVFQKMNVWPQSIPELDHEEGEPEKFTIDEKIYSGNQQWPSSLGTEESLSKVTLRSIPTIKGEIWPVSWNPTSGELLVYKQAKYIIHHEGEPGKFHPMTKERENLSSKHFLNWRFVKPYFPFEILFYSSSFLIIYPDSDHADEVKPFADQKKARGFNVTEMTVADIGSSCSDIRDAINTWEASVPSWHDAYALLIGDSDVIPHCTSPTGDQTDDLYASTDGDDLDEEIYLGRLSIDSQLDLENQINKILAYEDNPNLFCCYHEAGLWAHKENAPGKYVGAHETVRTNAYSNPPTFKTYYGSVAGIDDADIVTEVDSGVGVLAYRGHGSSSGTATGWNLAGETFNESDVNTLTNGSANAPVVWSFACTNSKLDISDSIAEKWMEKENSGSVSYYGATRTSYTSQNHVLDEWMFQAVYNEGLITQSHAIKRGEDQMASLSASSNAWMYLLLGDPDMQIRTENPIEFSIVILDKIRPCRTCELKLRVLDARGNPIANALVGLWKPSLKDGVNQPGEVFVNRYSDEKGVVSLPVSNLTPGALHYAVEDGQGNSVFNRIHVK